MKKQSVTLDIHEKQIFMLSRKLNLQDVENDSTFLWGARQTGKSTLLKMLHPDIMERRFLLVRIFLLKTLFQILG